MASNSETGHAKNVANFEDLISFCIGYGAVYNPANANLKITALQAKLIAGAAVLKDDKVTKTTLDNGTNAREIVFAPLKKLSTRVVNSLASTTAAVQTLNDAQTAHRKIQGKRADTSAQSVKKVAAPPSDPGAEPTPKQISVSQQSFDGLIDNFTKLIQVVSTESAYLPNETDLKVATLNTVLGSLKAANTVVINATTAYSNALIIRDTTLYAENTGLVDIAKEVKKYIKSVFTARSPQFRQVSGLKFTKPRK